MSRNALILLLIFGLILLVSIAGSYLIAGQGRDFRIGDKVAVIKLHGEIAVSEDTGISFVEQTTAEEFREMLGKAERDESVKAVVIDINTPGGSVVGSEEIAEAIKNAKKPTVAWLNELATSGGYYAASAADFIVADKASMTGSIGVISISPEFSRLMEKLGVNVTIVKGGKYKDFSSGFRPMSEEELRMVEEVVQEVYEQFVSDIAENRGLKKEYVKSVAEGKIYSGSKAVELKLADAVGNRGFAVKKAASMGGIRGEPVVVVYKRVGLFGELIGIASSNFGYGFAKGIAEVGKTLSLR